MPHSFGLRARTRHMFSRNFREHGAIPLSTYLKTYKVGDIVDIKANAACRQEFLDRVKENAQKKIDARAAGINVNLKRIPVQPRTARHVSTADNVPQTITAIPYETLL
ncbi:hypothetical protein [Absidia glauca]|uniref:60S ribosomal protein L21 n=1 Tax=Absidia glauca TaxID=4829 RepID=A0A163JC99_ABSGL|nr:hypothetical protein [Absidia glauca]